MIRSLFLFVKKYFSQPVKYFQVENRVDNQVRAGFIAQSLHCHPDGAIFLAVSEKGLVQCYDIALTPIQICFPNEEQVSQKQGLELRCFAVLGPSHF